MFLLRRFKTKLYPLEQTLLNVVIDRAPACWKDSLKEQVETINLIQRHAKAKEINFYRLIRGQPSFDDRIRLSFTRGEHKLCTIAFSPSNYDMNIKADVWMVNGFLFSLGFSFSPKEFLKCEDITVKELRFFDDAALQDKETEGWRDSALVPTLKQFFGDCDISQVNQPLGEGEKKRCITMLGTKFPDDYRQLMLIADGFEIGDWKVNGLATVRQVVDLEQNWYILAESTEAFLAVIEADSQGEVYYLVPGEDPVKLGKSFVAAMKTRLTYR
jgi:hypothetical protein